MSKEQLIAAVASANLAKAKSAENEAVKKDKPAKADKNPSSKSKGKSSSDSVSPPTSQAAKPAAKEKGAAAASAPKLASKDASKGKKEHKQKAEAADAPTTKPAKEVAAKAKTKTSSKKQVVTGKDASAVDSAAESPKSPKLAKASSPGSKSKSTAIGATDKEAKPAKRSPLANTAKGASAVAAKEDSAPVNPPKAKDKKSASKQATKLTPTTTSPKVLKKIRELQLQRESGKDIAFRPTLVRPPGASEPIWEKEPQKDRIGLFVRDPYWLHASWDITRNAIERARAALAEQWHTCKPVLRLLRLDDNSTSSPAETVERDIEIHGGLRNWYIPWTGVATSFRVLVGYLAANGRYHAIAKSNIVKTAAAGANDAVDEHWSDMGPESERIFALSGGYDSEHETGELREILEERVHRNLGAPALAKLGIGSDGGFRRRNDFHFDMDIELVVYGSTLSDGFLTLNGEPVTLRPDGTFAVRLPFPDRRQVLPAVACTRDGSQQRTIVVAVERNTKIMEPMEQERDTGD